MFKNYDERKFRQVAMFGLSYEEERVVHGNIARGMLYLSVPTFLALYFVVPTPLWGKTFPSVSGNAFNARWGWIAFESPNLIWCVVCYLCRNTTDEVQEDVGSFGFTNKLLLSLYFLHYVNRGVVYPLRIRHRKPLPVEVVLSALAFTTFNGYLQAQNLCQFQSFSDRQHLTSPVFLVGLCLFMSGVILNVHSDEILNNLRREVGGTRSSSATASKYRIPSGGGFRFVSAPHYLGEIVEWAGFAMMTNNSRAAWAFVAFTASNLVPRAVAHHKWYHEHFPNTYPRHRKAIVPFLW